MSGQIPKAAREEAGNNPATTEELIPGLQDTSARQRSYEDKVEEILAKPLEMITKDDARELQDLENRALGAPVGSDSLSAEVQSIADRNETIARAEESKILDEDVVQEQSYFEPQ
ncbi:hypothetical protein AJ80_00304 [Polytolypa hystricis UAMH7299]|uniref:SMP domain-containing protein n=1 Tax=Polytolypa hystricis (strain UAMH7299) TaxID=1447883 RepID=A0A2B7Z481_POLH7|nr:hypothetical protein AJ80_00304 [Polytolypa hystricis UAMH7299]